MQITNSYRTTTYSNTAARGEQASVDNNSTTATTRSTPPVNEANVGIPNTQNPIVDDARMIRYEVNELLQQFSEWIRVATESKRMEFLYNILLKESYETSDMFGTIMDIARRIMRGENVSLEEMRLLAEQNPQLLFVVIILRDEASNAEEKERRRDRERRTKDRRSVARRRDYGLRHPPPDANPIERLVYTPRELTKQVNPLIENKSIKKTYDTTIKGKTISISINTVITNPHDIAT